MQMETGGRKRRSPLGLEGRALAMAPWSVAQIAVRMKLCQGWIWRVRQFFKGFGDEGRRISSRLSRVAAGSDRVADRREILGQTPPAAVVRARLPLPPSKEYLRLRFRTIPSWSDGESRRKGTKVTGDKKDPILRLNLRVRVFLASSSSNRLQISESQPCRRPIILQTRSTSDVFKKRKGISVRKASTAAVNNAILKISTSI